MAAPKPAMAAHDALAGSASRIGRARVADQIIDELRAQIATGAYQRGSRLPTERELAAAFGVSAPTIREALRALSSMGLVEVRHGSGSYVASSYDGILNDSLGMLVQLEDVGVEDLIGLLRVLNLYAAELAIEQATEADIARVRAAAEATARAATLDQVTASITEFLVAFAAAAHKPLLDALCGFLVAMVVRLEVTSYRPKSTRFWADWAAQTSVYRLEVADALERRDGPALSEAVARFHARIGERIRAVPALRRARVSDPAAAPFAGR
jgi:GntR family transcriptional regulator, transcriptional repressor for pyruvate dehydrogenase complex